jgi:hypothetical protein
MLYPIDVNGLLVIDPDHKILWRNKSPGLAIQQTDRDSLLSLRMKRTAKSGHP